MAAVWTTPRTWIANERVTEVMLNTHLRDNLEFIAKPAAVRLNRSEAFTTTSGAIVPVPFDVESIKTVASMHSTSSLTSRIVAPYKGLYLLTAGVRWAAHSGGNRGQFISINQTNTVAGHIWPAGASALHMCTLSTIYKLNEDDYAELFVIQDSGGSLDLQLHNEHSPTLGMVYLGDYE